MKAAIVLLLGILLLIVAITDYESIRDDIKRQQDKENERWLKRLYASLQEHFCSGLHMYHIR